ncbi:NAD-dependent epimerase/dehydratase family protein [Spongiimicrobium sp. 3-5]|uniref:NAD-dependent epimerase/dehydratase family protein n=1 Tax=Spongiimicrobium sp. 3-5 TaxID=3332596 RepID=UPI0039816BFA
MNNAILITGANGQLGSVLAKSLQNKYGKQNVVASDIRSAGSFDGVFELIDATDISRLDEVVCKYRIKQIFHLAAILSANGEKAPLKTWDLNMQAWLNILETSLKNKVEKVFFPSSIAVFGESAPKDNTPNTAYLDPTTSYGISKAAGENWGHYYFNKYDLDVRSLRYPGLIGYQSVPGGGTTDYAVEVYHKAVLEERFSCFLREDTSLPMMFMDDAVRATIELMEAPRERITIRTSYNIAGTSFSPSEVVASIKGFYHNFKVSYNPDHRQNIAASWPKSIADTEAANDWGWKAQYHLNEITETMIGKLKEKYAQHESTIS